MALQIPMKCTGQDWKNIPDNPVELGMVVWERDYNVALSKSAEKDKPVFILFQEVPGCSTCSNYGKEVMSHPLIVEAIETYFIPLCIYNNKKEKDAEVLNLYGEPSWNNPVVRIVDEKGKNLIKRVSGNYSRQAVVSAMIDGLQIAGINVPGYLEILHAEWGTAYTEELILGMYCFWSGEKAMATISGIRETEAGFMGGKEVVRVRFDPLYISEKNLLSRARNKNCADVVFADFENELNIPTIQPSTFRKDPETKYYLYHSPYRSVPMTPLQALRINYILSEGGSPDYLLSSRQLTFKGENLNRIGKDMIASWYN